MTIDRAAEDVSEERLSMAFNLHDKAVIADPWPVLREIREHGPIVWHEPTAQWYTAVDRTCRHVLGKQDNFTVETSISAAVFGKEAFISIDDRKRHSALRNVWTRAFHRDTLAGLRGTIVDLANALLDGVEERLRAGETVDAMAGFCRHLPAYVIAVMMGLPKESYADIASWSDAIADASLVLSRANVTPEELAQDGQWQAGLAASANLEAFLMEQINYRARDPGLDLISEIVNSPVGRVLSDEILLMNTRQLLFAGNETTAKWLGHIMAVFGMRPDDRRALAGDRTLLPNAIEEVMRWEPVVHTLVRDVRGDGVELAGVPLRDGDRITLLTGGANRDPARHPDPDTFDIRRKQVGHLGFGFGLHNCLGITLARLEALNTFNLVLDRIPEFTLLEPVSFADFALRGPKKVEIALER